MSPDFSSYRLSDDESRRIFNTEILPAEILRPTDDPQASSSPLSSPTRPLAVLVVGQTGAGKTRLSPAILSALHPAQPTHLIADTYKTYHPEYARLSAQHASLATAPDARRWLTMASEEVSRRRLDVLLESACRYPNDFAHLARLFSRAGYRVEVVLLAVPAVLSRLGILVRYYDRLPESQSKNLPVRLTPVKVHDDSYAGMIHVSRFLDKTCLVDQVLIVRRGYLVAYAASKESGGKLAAMAGEGEGQIHKTSIEQALERERKRPLTQHETQTAWRDVQNLLTTHEDARQQGNQIAEMLQALTTKSEGSDAWPELKPLTFGKAGLEAGSNYSVLQLRQE